MNSGVLKEIIKGLAIGGTILLVIAIIKFFFAELNVADELITSIAQFSATINLPDRRQPDYNSWSCDHRNIIKRISLTLTVVADCRKKNKTIKHIVKGIYYHDEQVYNRYREFRC